MILYIAEKKVLAEAIASALNGKETIKDGVIIKGESVLVWCSGHLLTLKNPEDYDERYKNWSISDLPIFFENWEVKIPKENYKRVQQIGSLIKQADVVVNCGDVDEEGQLLVDEVLRYFHYSGPCKRLDTANTTVEALKKALKNMKDNSVCENDGWSAYARMVSDMLFGINLSRFYTKSYNTLLPVGRVQTPTLGMVVMRDLAIESHNKQYYYSLSATVRIENLEMKMKFVPKKDLPELTEGRFLSDAYLRHIAAELNGKTKEFTVKKEKVKLLPPLPFNLTELNNYCGKTWGYNPDQVMKITQALRDNYSAITYNRSDCQYLSMEHHKEAPKTIAAIGKNLTMPIGNFDVSLVSKCFNDSNITAHFAIIPTAGSVDMGKLTKEERNVYEIICIYYLIQFMPACIKEKTNISASVNAQGRDAGKLDLVETKIVSPGFISLLNMSDSENNNQDGVCGLPEGTYRGNILECIIGKNETKPPKRYTQSSLYNDMTKISKYVDDPEIKRLLLEKDKDKKGENGSIGTSATRAEIIKKLIHIGFLEERKEGKREILITTDKGRKFYRMLPDSIKKADTTALWWVIQEDIKKGICGYGQLTSMVLETVKEVIGAPLSNEVSAADFSQQLKAICKCPSCQGDVISGKYGPYCKEKCGFRLNSIFGKKLTQEQYISLCEGKKTKISGIKKSSGKGTFTAYAVPEGIEDFSYEKDGRTITGKQLKCSMVFK